MEIVKSFDGSSKVNCELIRFGKKESELGLRGYDNSFIPRGVCPLVLTLSDHLSVAT